MTNYRFLSWVIELETFQEDAALMLEGSPYKLSEDDFYVSCKRYTNENGRMASLDHNGGEFIVRTVSSHWTTDQAAEMLEQMQEAHSLAVKLNSLVASYQEVWESLEKQEAEEN